MKTLFVNSGVRLPKGSSKAQLREVLANQDPDCALDKLSAEKQTSVWEGNKIKLVARIGKRAVLTTARFDFGYHVIPSMGEGDYPSERFSPHWIL